MLRIAGISPESVVDGPGVRFTIFAQGCKHNCKGCHNPSTHSFDGGRAIEIEEIINQLKGKLLIQGVTFSGGDPFLQSEGFALLAQRIKEINNSLDILTYTGYHFEDLLEDKDKRGLLEVVDILVDGPFIEEKRDLGLKYRGSSNQRIIDVQRSIEVGSVVLYSED